MSSIVSTIAIVVIGAVIVVTLIKAERLEREAHAKAQPVMSE